MADIEGMPENAAEIAVANAINNINGRNRIVAGGVGGAQNNMVNMRDRLFHAIYFRAAATYAELVPRKVRLVIEFLLLAKALIFFLTLVYVHNAFIKNPCTCLQSVKNWPREGVIRVEIIPHLMEKRAIWQSIKQDQKVIQELKNSYYYNIGPQTYDNHYRLKRYESILQRLSLPIRPTFAYGNESLYYYFDVINVLDSYDHPNAIQLKNDDEDDEQYIVEYSLEYGHLRLTPATRKRLNIPVLTVQLDPHTNDCFGDKLTRYLLKRVLGYDDLLMASVRTVAEQEENKGYLRNVITGEHYRFVSMWWAAWSAYPAAFCVMLLFTFSTSMLLRYSHHQIFVFIVDLLQMLEYNVSARFPIAPLLTVILALVGMEAIMSEFFNDTTTAFYIILIVWIADQYDAICCHTNITKRHWLRFFYIYHFAFYAYHYRFSGQYRTLALISSYLFIQHSMVFFFHRYELPVIMAQRHVFIVTRNPNGAAAAAAAPGGQQPPVQRARFTMRRLFQQLAVLQQGARAGQENGAGQGQGQGQVPAPAANQPGVNNAAVAIALANLRRLPVVGQWLQRQDQFATVRRVFLDQGGNGQVMHVHLQRINMADIPGLRQHVTAASAQAANTTTTAAATTTTTTTPTSSTSTTSPASAADVGSERVHGNNDQHIEDNRQTSSTNGGTATISLSDVETNHGQKLQTVPAISTTTTTTNSMNVLDGESSGAGTTTDTVKMNLLDENVGDVAIEKGLQQATEPITDIINIREGTTTITNAAPATTICTDEKKIATLSHSSRDGATTTATLANQLYNNLLSKITVTQAAQEEEISTISSASQSELSKGKDAPYANVCEIINDQHQTESQVNANIVVGDVTVGGSEACTTSKQTNASVTSAAAVATATVAKSSRMMDGLPAVDFIEGDSTISTPNYHTDGTGVTIHSASGSTTAIATENSSDADAVTVKPNNIMKTAEHTSSQMTTATKSSSSTTGISTSTTLNSTENTN